MRAPGRFDSNVENKSKVSFAQYQNYNILIIECNFIAKYLIFLLQILKDMFRSVLCSKHFFNIMENEQDISDVKSSGILLNFS